MKDSYMEFCTYCERWYLGWVAHTRTHKREETEWESY